MTAESLPEHVIRPHMRPVQPMPVVKDKQQFFALRDPMMLVPQTLVVAPATMKLLQFFQGELALDEIAERTGGPVAQFTELAQRLDQVGLLWGPTFDRLEEEARERLRNHGAFPSHPGMGLGETEEECRKTIESYFDQTEDPEVEEQTIAIVTPHLDYARGWPNYAAGYYCVRDLDPPDRVVILGTNHFGLGDGVVLSEFGFDTPLGRVPTDEGMVSELVDRLGGRFDR